MNSHKHKYNAAAIMCVDGLWIARTLDFIFKEFGNVCDLHTIPGAAREFHQGISPFSVILVENIVRVSMGLHRVPCIIIFSHWNCGAYGGSESFFSAHSEQDTYMNHLRVARVALDTAIKGFMSFVIRQENTPSQVCANLNSYNGRVPEIRCFLWNNQEVVEVS